MTITQRILNGLHDDVNSFMASIAPIALPEPGLHTYRFKVGGDREFRIHLRIEPQGHGVLFVDVTDVIHLNTTAAHMAKMALDAIPLKRARAELLLRYPVISLAQIDRELTQIYQMVEGFSEFDSHCATCAIADLADVAPLFSVKVNAPYKVDIALTYGCNNACPHCYNENDRLDMLSLPLEQWKDVLEKIAAIGVPHVILTGGEATLHPDLPRIIELGDRLGMIMGLNTNGRHIAHPGYMRELADAGLNHVQVTLGSCHAEIHDAMMGAKSFKQTVRGIQNAVESRVHTITNTTLMRSNMDHVDQIINFIHDIGITTFAMNGMIYSGGGFSHPTAIPQEALPPLLVHVRNHSERLGMRFLWYTPTEYCMMSRVEIEIGAKRCNAGEYSLCIEPNGDVLPCQSYYVSAGNILQDPWEEIWHSDLFVSFRDREADPKKYGLPEKCWECPDLPLCGGGCRIEREAREGVRVSEQGGGGCSGCSGSCGTAHSASIVRNLNPTAGYVSTDGYAPPVSQISTKHRASGDMPLITLDDIGVSQEHE